MTILLEIQESKIWASLTKLSRTALVIDKSLLFLSTKFATPAVSKITQLRYIHGYALLLYVSSRYTTVTCSTRQKCVPGFFFWSVDYLVELTSLVALVLVQWNHTVLEPTNWSKTRRFPWSLKYYLISQIPTKLISFLVI